MKKILIIDEEEFNETIDKIEVMIKRRCEDLILELNHKSINYDKGELLQILIPKGLTEERLLLRESDMLIAVDYMKNHMIQEIEDCFKGTETK